MITCNNCKSFSCYQCGEQIKGEEHRVLYAHFNKYDEWYNNNLCRLYEDIDFKKKIIKKSKQSSRNFYKPIKKEKI